MSATVTQWIDCKPENIGVYEVKGYLTHKRDTAFQYWNGHFFGLVGMTIDAAYEVRHYESIYQSLKWRGLASQPDSQEKE